MNMNEQDIKNLLTSYVREEMALIFEEDQPGYDHVYSNAYKKRIKRMFWSEKYFGCKLHFGYMLRRIAVVVIIILSLFTANEVSARVLGFNPWKFITSFLSDSRMGVKTYTEQTSDLEHVEFAVIKRDVPIKIPDKFEKVAFNQDDISLYVEWGNEEEYLQYSRIKLSADMSLAMDGEYKSKEKITIIDFAGDYCVKEGETWIVWEDGYYNHMITAGSVDKSKEILLDMAESLYK